MKSSEFSKKSGEMGRSAVIMVTVYLWGDTLKPDDVAERLGIKATRYRVKGETRRVSSGKTARAPTGMWAFETEKFVSSADINSHILYLNSVFNQKISEKRDDLNVEDACIDIYVTMPREEEQSCSSWVWELSPEAILAATELGLPIRFTVTCPAKN